MYIYIYIIHRFHKHHKKKKTLSTIHISRDAVPWNCGLEDSP